MICVGHHSPELGTMLDVNRDRLRHLMANAILELWKKETGSLTPVIIEGTICITSGNGRTTVIQVGGKFAGHSLQYYDRATQQSRRNGVSDGTGNHGAVFCGPNVDIQTSSAAAMAAYLDDLSPASLVSPLAEGSHTSITSGPGGSGASGGSRPSSRTDYSKTHRSVSGSSSQEPSCSAHTETSVNHDSGINCSSLEQSVVDDYNHKPLRINDTIKYRGSTRELDAHSYKDNFEDDDDDDEDDEYIEITTENRKKDGRDHHNMNTNNCHNLSGIVYVRTGYSSSTHIKPIAAQERLATREPVGNDDRCKEEEEGEEHENSGMDTTDDLSLNETRGGPMMSTPKNSLHYPERMGVLDTGSPALDLSRRDPEDLAISPPQNYTDQVRNVIRQRLLAQKFAINQHRIEGEVVKDPDMSSNRRSPSPVSPGLQRTSSEERAPSFSSKSLPSTPASAFPLPHLLSPEHASRLMFPFPPFAQHRNMLYAAEHFQNLVHRSMAGLIPHSPQGPIVERPSSEPSTPNALAHSPVPSDRLSSSFDGRQTPQSSTSNGEQKVYSCDFCHKTFLFKSKYHEHLPVHTNARPFQCRLCSRTYKYKYDLRVHLRTHLGIPTKSTLCPFCNAKFDTNKLLRHHIKDIHRDHHKVLSEEQLQMFDAV